MGGHVAIPGPPFNGGIRKNHAVFAGGAFKNLLATLALFNDYVTVAAIKLAAFLAHKGAFDTFLCGCTNHGYHILSFDFEK